MPGKPRGIVQTIHNMGALYKHLHHVRDKRLVRTIGITYPQRYSHGLFIPLKQGKYRVKILYLKQIFKTLLNPHYYQAWKKFFSFSKKSDITLIFSLHYWHNVKTLYLTESFHERLLEVSVYLIHPFERILGTALWYSFHGNSFAIKLYVK